jgi:hypothetical protein
MKRRIMLAAALAAPLAIAATSVQAQAPGEPARYMTPPAPIAQILDAPPPPTPSVSPNRTTIALLGRFNLPPIAELAEPDLKLGGFRINPRNNGPANSRLAWLNALSFQDVASGRITRAALPAGTRFFQTAGRPTGRAWPCWPTPPRAWSSGWPRRPRAGRARSWPRA